MGPTPVLRRRLASGFGPAAGRAGALASGRAAAAAFQAGTLVIAARAAGTERFGVAVAVIGVLTFSYAVADLGLNNTLLRTVAADPLDGAIGTMLRAKAVTSCVAAALLGLLLLVPPVASIDLADRTAAGLLAGWALLEMWTETAFVLNLGRGAERAAALTLIVRRGIPFLAIMPLASVLPVEQALALSLVLGGLGAVSLNVGLVRRRPPRDRVGPGGLRPLFARTRPFWLAGLSAQLAQLGPALVGLVSGTAAAGAFGAANRLTGPLVILPASLANVALVSASQSPQGSRRHRPVIYRTTVSLTVVCTVMFVVISIAATPVCRVLLGDDFLTAIGPLRILLAAFALVCVTQPLAAMLQGEGVERPVSRLLVCVSVTGLGLVLAGARLGGAQGAAWGVFAMQCGALIGVTVLVRRDPNRPAVSPSGRTGRRRPARVPIPCPGTRARCGAGADPGPAARRTAAGSPPAGRTDAREASRSAQLEPGCR